MGNPVFTAEIPDAPGAAKLLEAARSLPLAAIIHTKEVQHPETVDHLGDFGLSHGIHSV